MTAERIGRPRFVTIEEAPAFHAIAIREYGGGQGLRDRGALESALAMPRQSFGGAYAHNFPFGMAAAYAFHISKNHPFVDGNKRVALLCCTTFLRFNGWTNASEGAKAANAILEMLRPPFVVVDVPESAQDPAEAVSEVTREGSKEAFASWLESHCRQLPELELRDFLLGVRLEDLVKFAESVVAGGRESEAEQSTHEAARAIPLIDQLERQARELAHVGDEDNDARARALSYCSGIFVSLYRLAEDMGYEW